MKIKRTVTALMAAAFLLSLTACAKKEASSENSGGASASQTDSASATSGVNSGVSAAESTQDDVSSAESAEANVSEAESAEEEIYEAKPIDPPNIWEIMPEIPVTDAGAFEYEYDSELGGVVVTDYYGDSLTVSYILPFLYRIVSIMVINHPIDENFATQINLSF